MKRTRQRRVVIAILLICLVGFLYVTPVVEGQSTSCVDDRFRALERAPDGTHFAIQNRSTVVRLGSDFAPVEGVSWQQLAGRAESNDVALGGLTVGPDGSLWVATGTDVAKLSADRRTVDIRRQIPAESAGPVDIAWVGEVWVVAHSRSVTVYNRSWALVNRRGGRNFRVAPTGLTGDDGTLWIVERDGTVHEYRINESGNMTARASHTVGTIAGAGAITDITAGPDERWRLIHSNGSIVETDDAWHRTEHLTSIGTDRKCRNESMSLVVAILEWLAPHLTGLIPLILGLLIPVFAVCIPLRRDRSTFRLYGAFALCAYVLVPLIWMTVRTERLLPVGLLVGTFTLALITTEFAVLKRRQDEIDLLDGLTLLLINGPVLLAAWTVLLVALRIS